MVVVDADTTLEAQQNIVDLCSEGYAVILEKPATQDELGETTSKTTLDVNAYPVRFEPYDRSFVNKVAWAKEMDVVIYIAKKTQDDADRTIRDLEQYSHMQINKRKYGIKRIEQHIQVGSDFLYYLIGGKRN